MSLSHPTPHLCNTEQQRQYISQKLGACIFLKMGIDNLRPFIKILLRPMSPEVGVGPPAPPCADSFYLPTGHLQVPLLQPPLQHSKPRHWLFHSLPVSLPCWEQGPPLHRLNWDITAAASAFPQDTSQMRRSYFKLLPPPQPLSQGRKQQHSWTSWHDLARPEQWCGQHPCLHGHLPAGG